jgi:hypothetical protein
MADDWMEKASAKMKSKGTVGLFTKKAKAAGKSVGAYAAKESSAPGKLGKEARFAKVARSRGK